MAQLGKPRLSNGVTALLLAAIVLVALALRLYGIDWDQGSLFHPDERAIYFKLAELSLPFPPDLARLFDPKTSPLNPHWFPYGSFPLYLLKLTAHLLSFFQASLAQADLRLVGRGLSAVFDVGTVVLVFLLGARLYGRRVGLLAAALLALTVLNIQQSHFFVVDPVMAFFVVAAMLALHRVMRQADRTAALVSGLLLGLALASKVSAAPLVLSVVVAYGLYVFAADKGILCLCWPAKDRLARALQGLLLTAVVATLTFAMAQPFALLDSPKFLADTTEQSEMVRRIRDYPYTRQYIDTSPYLYQMEQLTLWGMGLPLGLAAWVGFAFTLAVALRSRRRTDLLLLSWVLPYFLVDGSFAVKYLRYMLPLTPFLAIMAGRLLLAGGDWARDRGARVLSRTVAVITGLVILATLLYALAYVNIYAQPHPANRVSDWVKSNVPRGSHVLTELWDEGLRGLGSYRESQVNLYEPDSSYKIDVIMDALQRADYIALYSQRLYTTLSRLPDQYPITGRYYRLLFTGQLGFKLETFAVSYPSLFGVSLEDDTFRYSNLPEPPELAAYSPTPFKLSLGFADESFTVYDHPKVLLFKKVESLDPARLRLLLSNPLAGEKTGLLLSQTDAKAAQEGGTWSQIFPQDSFGNRFPALTWLVMAELIALAALPLTMVLFSSLADRGYLLAKALGILIIAYLAWLGASLHVIPFSRLSVGATIGALALVSAAIYLWRRKDINQALREKWLVMVLGELLFIGAFLFFVYLRLQNPDLWHPYRGGEKPMDFAYLLAVTKSTYMPPYDPWFAGGYLNYYYFGHFIIASLIKLTGIVPSVAYNLAVPLLFALTVGGAFSLAYNLVEAARSRQQQPEGLSRWARNGALLAGLAGAIFVAVLGNLDGLVQLVQGLGKVLGGGAFPSFDYWRSSRMMPPSISITEFPYFTFLFADLHAHLIALPFTILAAAMALATALGFRSRQTSNGEGRPSLWGMLKAHFPFSQVALLSALSLILGALRATNSWDFPTYLLLATAAVFIAEYSAQGRFRWSLLGWGATKMALLYALSTLLYLPFHWSFQLFYTGVVPSKEQTPVHQYLAVHGFFMFLLISLLGVELYRSGVLKALGASWRTGKSGCLRWVLGCLIGATLLPLLVLLALLISQGYQTVALLTLLLGVVLALAVKELLRPRPEMSPRLFLWAMAGLALALGVGVDVITLQGDIERMNTVFKFYLQAWVLLGVVSAYALWSVLLSPSAPRPRPLWKEFWLAGFLLLLSGTLIYPLAATPVRLGDRFNSLPPTLEGMAYMPNASYLDEYDKGKIARVELKWDYEAILWIQDHVQGSPVILELAKPDYRYSHFESRVSVYTGLPTVIGWDWHQTQQRWGYQDMVQERLRDVASLYTTTNAVLAENLLRQYDVSYVYVGQLERLNYPAQGLAKFDLMVGRTLELAYSNPQVKLYRVK